MTKPNTVLAILSDVHANIDALEAVLADMKTLGIEGALCLGDTVGYGPEPAECLRLVSDHCVASVMGNHEAMLLFLEKTSDDRLAPSVAEPLILALKQLSSKEIGVIRNLPIAIDLDAFEVVHASYDKPAEFNYIQSDEEAASNFREQKRPVSFHGHTHVPAIWEENERGRISCYGPAEKPVKLSPDRRFSVNVGSVGQPRDNNPKACYAIYNYADGTLLHRRVPYNIKKALKRFHAAGLPGFNSSRLTKGR